MYLYCTRPPGPNRQSWPSPTGSHVGIPTPPHCLASCGIFFPSGTLSVSWQKEKKQKEKRQTRDFVHLGSIPSYSLVPLLIVSPVLLLHDSDQPPSCCLQSKKIKTFLVWPSFTATDQILSVPSQVPTWRTPERRRRGASTSHVSREISQSPIGVES